MLENTTGVAGINWLRNSNNGNTVFFTEFFSQFNGSPSGTAEPVKQVHKDMRYIFVSAGRIQHPLKLFSPICFGTFIYAAKIIHDFKAGTGCIFFNGFALPVKGEIGIKLLLG
ncbi:MAG: hypothetical protein IPL97_11845 [Niastella sp.]|nr:hypothetical protein [Niastella sp.]